MTSLTLAIVIVFCVGYFFIAIESLTKVNKAAVALLMFVATWTLLMLDPGQYIASAIGAAKALEVSSVIEHHLGATSTTLFFLMGAMTIVELVDQNGGFNFVRDTLRTKSKRGLLWRIAFMTFILDCDDHDSAQTRQRQERPHDLCRAGHHRCQFRWRFLAHWRRDHYHALEQGRDYRSGRYL